MKQLFRFFFQPATFVNQLQWSSHHWLVILAFMGVALFESQVGAGRVLSLQMSWLLSEQTGLARDHALFVVTVGRIVALLFGVFLLSEMICFIADWNGHPSSARVLFRRLTVVLTLMLGGHAVGSMHQTWSKPLSTLLIGWGLLFGYFAIREQFRIARITSLVVGSALAAIVIGTWNFSDRTITTAVSHSIAKQIARSGDR